MCVTNLAKEGNARHLGKGGQATDAVWETLVDVFLDPQVPDRDRVREVHRRLMESAATLRPDGASGAESQGSIPSARTIRRRLDAVRVAYENGITGAMREAEWRALPTQQTARRVLEMAGAALAQRRACRQTPEPYEAADRLARWTLQQRHLAGIVDCARRLARSLDWWRYEHAPPSFYILALPELDLLAANKAIDRNVAADSGPMDYALKQLDPEESERLRAHAPELPLWTEDPWHALNRDLASLLRPWVSDLVSAAAEGAGLAIAASRDDHSDELPQDHPVGHLTPNFFLSAIYAATWPYNLPGGNPENHEANPPRVSYRFDGPRHQVIAHTVTSTAYEDDDIIARCPREAYDRVCSAHQSLIASCASDPRTQRLCGLWSQREAALDQSQEALLSVGVETVATRHCPDCEEIETDHR